MLSSPELRVDWEPRVSPLLCWPPCAEATTMASRWIVYPDSCAKPRALYCGCLPVTDAGGCLLGVCPPAFASSSDRTLRARGHVHRVGEGTYPEGFATSTSTRTRAVRDSARPAHASGGRPCLKDSECLEIRRIRIRKPRTCAPFPKPKPKPKLPIDGTPLTLHRARRPGPRASVDFVVSLNCELSCLLLPGYRLRTALELVHVRHVSRNAVMSMSCADRLQLFELGLFSEDLATLTFVHTNPSPGHDQH